MKLGVLHNTAQIGVDILVYPCSDINKVYPTDTEQDYQYHNTQQQAAADHQYLLEALMAAEQLSTNRCIDNFQQQTLEP